jgi:hypothetical protein
MREAEKREVMRRRVVQAHDERERVFRVRHEQYVESLHQEQRLITKARQEPILDVDLVNWLHKSDISLEERLWHAELSFNALQRRRAEELNDALKGIEKGDDPDLTVFEGEVDSNDQEVDQEFISALRRELEGR